VALLPILVQYQLVSDEERQTYRQTHHASTASHGKNVN